MNWVYDGSYAGFLTTVFESFEWKDFNVRLYQKNGFSAPMFEENKRVESNPEKVIRIINGLKTRLNTTEISNIHKVFLSEDAESIQAAFYIVQQIFKGNKDILQNFGNSQVHIFDRTLTKVNRERHRMKAFIRFQKASDDLFFAIIEPDFNVLPLITSFFKNRYADQKWLIYDVKRKYGIMYDRVEMREVNIKPTEVNAIIPKGEVISLDEDEILYQSLWKRYFKSTNIEARKNMKLHLQHVPRRYWKYLTEKE